MRDTSDRVLALECLRLALGHHDRLNGEPIDNAAKLFAFVTGSDVDDAKAKLDAVRAVVS